LNEATLTSVRRGVSVRLSAFQSMDYSRNLTSNFVVLLPTCCHIVDGYSPPRAMVTSWWYCYIQKCKFRLFYSAF